MDRFSVIRKCRAVYDSGMVYVRFERDGSDWKEANHKMVRPDGFLIYGNDVSIDVNGETRVEKYRSFSKALDAVDQFMADYEE